MYALSKAMTKQWSPIEIKEFRKRLKFRQVDFAELVGVTRMYVVLLEKGVRNPSKTLKILLSMMEQREHEKGNENETKGGLKNGDFSGMPDLPQEAKRK
jgi:DNA-binding XRE family transcriptional regulator